MELINEIPKLNKRFIGTIININVETRECDVYIPELMMTLPSETIINNSTILNLNNIKNSNLLNINNKITKINYFRVKSENINNKMPTVGSKVLIYFIDDNIQLGFWREFNSDNSLEYISEEKYSKLFTLVIGNKIINVKEDDIIQIQLPEELEVIYKEENKSKLFLLQKTNKSNEVNLEKTVQDLSLTVDLLITENKNNIILKLNNYKDNLVDSIYKDTLTIEIEETINYISSINQLSEINNSNYLMENKLNVSTILIDKYNELINIYNNKPYDSSIYKLADTIENIDITMNNANKMFSLEDNTDFNIQKNEYLIKLDKIKTMNFRNPFDNIIIQTYTDEIFTDLDLSLLLEENDNRIIIDYSTDIDFINSFSPTVIENNIDIYVGYFEFNFNIVVSNNEDLSKYFILIQPENDSTLTINNDTYNFILKLNDVNKTLIHEASENIYYIELTKSEYDSLNIINIEGTINFDYRGNSFNKTIVKNFTK